MIVQCKACGKDVKTYPSRLKVYNNIFCSRECTKGFVGFKKGYTPFNKGRKTTTIRIENGRRIIHFGRTEQMYYNRYLMEQYLGRKLTNREQVHHIDGNPLNDCIENYKILDIADHARLHSTGKVYPERQKKVVLLCKNCNREFQSVPSKLDRMKFCSKECRKNFDYKRPDLRDNKCLGCGKLIMRKSLRCRSCSQRKEVTYA